jgi:hypothetical protein
MSADSRRLRAIIAAGLIDSAGMALGWTVLLLLVLAEHGSAAGGLCAAAMLLGVAASSPVARVTAGALPGRALLQLSAGVEAPLRLAGFALVLAGAPLGWLLLCIFLTNIAGWTGYAGMRAEVAAVHASAGAMTWFVAGITAVEALGAATAALLPRIGTADAAALCAIAAVSALALLPTMLVARASRVPRSEPVCRPLDRRAARRLRPDGLMLAAGGLLLLGSGPTLFAVALAEGLHGRGAIAYAAGSFLVGSLLAPFLARGLERWVPGRAGWTLCAAGMLAGWVLAPAHVLFLCLAQVASGACLTALEGLLDAAAVRRRPLGATGALARISSARALGSAAAVALMPGVVRDGIPVMALAAVVAVLLVGGVALHRLRRDGEAPVMRDMPARTVPALVLTRPLTPAAV